MRQQLESRHAALGAAFRTVLLQRRSRFERLAGSLEALSPLAILERGYALVFDPSGKLVKDSSAVKAGDEVKARLAHGEITATVKKSS
jgi:exodeoxyribonuclease VII large subunit